MRQLRVFNVRSRIVSLAGVGLVFAAMAFGQATITSVTPNSAPAYSAAIAVTIAGSNLTGATAVVFTPPGGTGTTITPSQTQAAQIAVTIPAVLLSTPGTAQIAIQTGAGVLSNQLPFTVAGPAITSLTPNSSVAHRTATGITIAGSNFTGASTVVFTAPGGATVATLTPTQIQAAQLAATLPAALLSTAGTAQIAIQNGSGALSNQLPFAIGAAVSVQTPALSAGTVGTLYSGTVSATGGSAPYSWTLLGGAFPPGISLSPSGVISGNPTTPGPSGAAIQVTDAAGAVASAIVSIVVNSTPFANITGALPSGVVNFDYPKQILANAGGVAPYTFAITSGALPAGMTLSNGVIGGVSTTAGTSAFTITATDSAGTQTQSATSINVRAATPDLVLLAGSVSFALATGATGPPPAQTVGVQSAAVAQTLSYTIASSTAPWLSVTGDGTTPGYLSFSLTGAALSLPVGTSAASVTLTCTTAACAGKTQNVAVSLVVASPSPQLSVASTLLTFRSTSITPAAQSQPLGIQNTGGGSLAIASISCESTWCKVGAFPASLNAGPSTLVNITVDPSTLQTGLYRTALDIATSAGTVSVPVTFLISSSPYMNLSQSGAQFNMQVGGAPGNPSGSFLVDAVGGTFSWAASVLPGAAWLTLGTTSGTALDPQPGVVGYSINSSAATLAAGTYFADIQVTSPGTIDTALAYVVVLRVTPASQPASLFPSPAGLVFLTNVGVTPATQVVSVYTNSTAPQSYQAATDTTWLSAAGSGTTSSAAADKSVIGVNPTGLVAGFYFGHVSYALGGAGVPTVNVLLAVLPAGVTFSNIPTAGLKPFAVCSPTALSLLHTGLVNNFAAPASWPTPLAVTLINDCGNPVPLGQVVATFSNGDPPLALSQANAASGLYSGTWTPRNSSAQVTINARATAAGLTAATAQIAGSVLPNIAPVLTPNGTVQPYNPQIGGAIAPGTIVAIYGSNLAATAGQPTTTPLPTLLNGTTALIGGIPAPLFYVGPGQINAEIPFELDPTKQYQVVVSANGALTTPQPIQLSAASPGLDSFPDATLIAVHAADGTLVSQTSPARPGEYLVMYLLGMGPTDNPVTTGAGSPGSPLDRPLAVPTLTLGGVGAPVAFAGLTPGLVGLYQINLLVPNVPSDGNLVLTVSQNGIVTNTTILPVHF